MVVSPAREPFEDLLQVADGRFDGSAASLVQLVPVGGVKSRCSLICQAVARASGARSAGLLAAARDGSRPLPITMSRSGSGPYSSVTVGAV